MLDGRRHDGHEVRLANAPLGSRAHQIAPGPLVEQRRLGGAQRQLGPLHPGVQHLEQEVAAALEGGLRQRQGALAQLVQLRLQGVGALVEMLVDVPQRRLHLADGVDAALGDPHRHAGLQQDEGGLDAGDEGARRVGDQLILADEVVLEGDAPGARALHAGEGRALAQRHLLPAVQHEHDLVGEAAVGALDPGQGAAVLAGGDMAHPGQGAADPVAPRDPPGPQRQALDPRQRLHGVGERRAAEAVATGVALQEVTAERRVARLLQVEAEDIVGPDQKAGGAAVAADLGHGADGLVEALAAAVQVGPQAPGAPQGRHDLERIVALVDAPGHLGQRSGGDLLDLAQEPDTGIRQRR
ncbi:hypothetical protein HALA3H3_p60009 [Halomonas sp. A3H3]|nr:hypothetical protein HALA3H3_p60009 [Halomonas sp. A3H3]